MVNDYWYVLNSTTALTEEIPPFKQQLQKYVYIQIYTDLGNC